MDKKKPVSPLVTMSNRLMEARYSLGAREQKTVLALVSKLSPEDDDLQEYTFNIDEFLQFVGIRNKHYGPVLREMIKNLQSIVLLVEKPDGNGFNTYNWINFADYNKREKKIVLSIEPRLRPYLLNLKGNFTKYNLWTAIRFKGRYTIRIYQLLKQYQKIGERTFDVEEFRAILGIGKDQYKQFKELNKWVIKYAKKEFETEYEDSGLFKSDISFNLETIRSGRSISQIKFMIIAQAHHQVLPFGHPLIVDEAKINETDVDHKKGEQDSIESSDKPQKLEAELEPLLQEVPESHRNKKTVYAALQRFLKSHGQAYVLRNIGYTNDHATSSYAGYLNNCLKEDWGCDWIPGVSAIPQKRIGGIPMDQVEQQARPGESWEQAAGRIAKVS